MCQKPMKSTATRFGRLSSKNKNEVLEALIDNLHNNAAMRRRLYEKCGVVFSNIECPYNYFIAAPNIDEILGYLEESADEILSEEYRPSFSGLGIAAPESLAQTRTRFLCKFIKVSTKEFKGSSRYVLAQLLGLSIVDAKTNDHFVFMATAATMRASLETLIILHELIDAI